jgi:glutamate/aspartate transport system substrate-binding protein
MTLALPMLSRIAAVLLAAGCAMNAVAQHAAAPGAPHQTSRLDRIAATGQFVIGFRENAVPFAFLDANQEPAGYGVEIARAVASAVKERLGKPDLAVRYNSVTPTTRFPLIVNGVVDIECGSTTNTLERRQLVAFSNTIFVSLARIAVPKGSAASRLEDLQGRRVAVAADTTTDERLRRIAAARGLDLKLVPARNNLRAFQALERGNADAFVAGEALLAGEFARAGRTADFRIVGEPLEREAFACVLPRNEPEFKRLVDDTIARLMASGELERIHERWFMRPLGTGGHALGLPISAELRALMAAPNDLPLQ